MHERGRHKSKAPGSGIWNQDFKRKLFSGLSTSLRQPNGLRYPQLLLTHFQLAKLSSLQPQKEKLSLPLRSSSNVPGCFVTRPAAAAHRPEHLSPPHQQLRDPSALPDNPQTRGKGCFQISCWKSSSKIAAEFKSPSNYSSGGFLGFSFKQPI